jgi:uncharacterized membrane protein YraQ (UPF0718 family)
MQILNDESVVVIQAVTGAFLGAFVGALIGFITVPLYICSAVQNLSSSDDQKLIERDEI